MGNTVQNTYNERLDSGRAGFVPNKAGSVILSRNVEGASGLEFGAAVAQGDEDMGVTPFGSGDTAVLGVAVRVRSLDANEPDKYPQYESASILTKGAIFVEASVEVSAGDPVYVVPATGAFANTSDSSAVQIVGARWETSAAADSLGVIRLS